MHIEDEKTDIAMAVANGLAINIRTENGLTCIPAGIVNSHIITVSPAP